MPPVQYSVARSTYTRAPLWALVVDDNGAFEVVSPSGAKNEDQTRRIERRVERAKTPPKTPADVVKLAGINMSAVTFSPLQTAASFDDAKAALSSLLGTPNG